MTDYVLKTEPIHLNVSPTGFRKAAREFFKCYLDFCQPGNFSLVPFFLCCRSIELALKAEHLECANRKHVKDVYGHDLEKSYLGLPANKQTLNPVELNLLTRTTALYKTKAFEYFFVEHAATGYTVFPKIEELANLTRKILVTTEVQNTAEE